MSQLMSQIRRGSEQVQVKVDFPEILEKHRAQIERALPKHLSVDRIMRIALTAFRKVPKLAECDPVSVLAAVMQASQLGLEVQQNGEAYLVPFDRECQLIPGYKGLMKLARNSGIVRDIYAHEVRAKDLFDCDLGAERRLVHKPMLGEGNFPAPDALRGHVVGYYAVAILRDGTPTFVIKHALDVETIRDESKGYKSARRGGRSTPWDTHPVQMGKKTVIRLLCNSQLPMSAELQVALALDNADLMGVKQGLSLEQVADGIYDAPDFGVIDDIDDALLQQGAPMQQRQAPMQQRQQQAPMQQRQAPMQQRQAPAPQRAHPPTGSNSAPAPAPAPAPARRSQPSTGSNSAPAQAPSRQATQAQPKSDLDKVINDMRQSTTVPILDEIAIWSETRFHGANLDKLNQVYREVRENLEPQPDDLFM